MNSAILKTLSSRKDIQAMLGGVIFSLAFTGLIAWAGQFLDTSNFLPDQGADWYFWRLPNPTFWTHATAWGLYLLHQLTLWGLIYYAQTRVKTYTTGLHRVNVLALGLNALFILLHFVQTHIWYDGLAQDVSIWSSQVSVVILLVWVLLMENNRRGLFAGKKVPISKSIIAFARKYHGYFFAWASVYTFWYHPMANTPGHLVGFMYMFLLLLQGSLFLTRLHVNKVWTAVQEVAVLFHGTLVAVYQGNGSVADVFLRFCRHIRHHPDARIAPFKGCEMADLRRLPGGGGPGLQCPGVEQGLRADQHSPGRIRRCVYSGAYFRSGAASFWQAPDCGGE